MRVSVRWLRDLVPGLEGGAQELADRLSMAATGVEEILEVGGGLDGIVVARVLEVEPHPDADRLSLCRVDAGGEPVEVVCGAPVIEAGALYPFVAPGRSLPDGLVIEERAIRGVTSHGMLCSERELGLGGDASGILRLPDGLEPGQDLAEALGLPDESLDLEITPNRVDLACHLGVARELAAEQGLEARLPRLGGPGWEPAWSDGEGEASAAGVTVRIEDPERCGRYLGAVVRGVRVGPSPAWLQGRLRAVGARPINNVVDATNYVLREMNQPLHAFDLGTLRGAEIRVRAAGKGERLVTLDGKERKLGPEATVIADAEGPVALAGVMGGEASEVTDGTTDLFLECAWFDPTHTRHTARSVDLSTDASYRFERGVDRRAAEAALARCVELVLATAGGTADEGAVRVGPLPGPRTGLPLRPSRVRQVLGLDLDADRIAALLAPLGFERTDEGGSAETPTFLVPGWREGDVTREADLVEEVARRHGYEAFPSELRRVRPSAVPADPAFARSDLVRRVFVARGFLEARSSSLVSRAEADPERPLGLLHPLSAEEGYLRGALVPVLLRRLEHNFARGERDVRLYEIGTAFRRREDAGGEVPAEESLRAGAVLTGRRRPEHWSEAVPDVDVWDLKGLAEAVAVALFGARLVPAAGRAGSDAAGAEVFGSRAWLGAERFVLEGEEGPVGIAGRVRPEAVDAPPWAGPVWALEFRLEAVRVEDRRAYAPVSPYPAVPRDLALLVPEGVEAAEVGAAAREAGPEWLEDVRLFDVYEGEGLAPGHRSLAFRFRFRAPDRTLEEAEVEKALEGITRRLEERFDARVRSS